MRWITIAICSACSILIAGCAGQARKDLATAEATTPTGSAFNQNLHAEYVTIAKRELAEGDPRSAEHFSKKAIAAAQGGSVGPEDFTTFNVLPQYREQANDGRARLVSALNSPAANGKPAQAAKAQANFDCWMQEASEPWWQPEDRAFCWNNFETALADLTATAAAPAAAPPPRAEEFLVFFDFDSARLTPQALDIVRSAADTAKKGNYTRIILTGHTDTVGPADYNFALSRRRADAVQGELVQLGLPSSDMSVEAKGKSEPLVPTGDGVAEPQNRRVEILMR